MSEMELLLLSIAGAGWALGALVSFGYIAEKIDSGQWLPGLDDDLYGLFAFVLAAVWPVTFVAFVLIKIALWVANPLVKLGARLARRRHG